MQILVDWAKNRWHEDLVSDPVVHGWALNLYRAGERYPQTVADYFPAESAPSPQLAEALPPSSSTPTPACRPPKL